MKLTEREIEVIDKQGFDCKFVENFREVFKDIGEKYQMRKHFRIVKSALGYTAEMNTRWALGDRFLNNPNWEDSWMPMGLIHETIDDAQKDIEDYKINTKFEVVYEE